MLKEITIIGGGLAGVEASYYCLKKGYKVNLYEMKPKKFSPAHSLDTLGELVCSNSLKSMDLENASGLLKAEMTLMDSLILKIAKETSVPAGKSLSVDRVLFSDKITKTLIEMGVNIINEEVEKLPDLRPLILATGPLTSDALSEDLKSLTGEDNLYFYDAIAPVIYKDSIDFDIAFFASRYGKGGDDYINLPFTKEEYDIFYDEIIKAEKVELKSFEKKIPFFESCMPIEELCKRGYKTPLFGPLKPVGLEDPKTGKRAYGVCQLRAENKEMTTYNIVGFQTNLTYKEQKRVFSMMPGLKNARFARLGSMHRNSFINSPMLLNNTLEFKENKGLFFAGQITGVEGYVESAMTGILAGINAVNSIEDKPLTTFTTDTMSGSLMEYITDMDRKKFQPVNANFGILKGASKKGDKSKAVDKALENIKKWVTNLS